MKIATGRKRYRVHTRWIGDPLVVLQIEYTITGRTSTSNAGGRIDIESLPDTVEWYDARPEDLMKLDGDNQ